MASRAQGYDLGFTSFGFAFYFFNGGVFNEHK
jgi:hypothetical protein